MSFSYYTVFSLIFLVSLTAAEFNPTQITSLQDLELTSSQATGLCKKIKDTRLADQQSYLWTKVHAHEESENDQATLSAQCFKLKYLPCGGGTRYPVTESCGFFLPIPDENCSSNKRSQRSSTQHIALTHNTANHICHSVNDLPTDSPLSVNYVPIKILLVQPRIVSQADDCIHWVHRECNADYDQTGCGWTMVVDPSEKCLSFTKFFSSFNATHQERYPHPALSKTDFLESKDDDGTSVPTNSFMSGVVKCLKKEHSVSCQIVPEEKGTRSKRAAATSKSPITRVKRSCCNFHRCRPCGFGMFFRQDDNCDCSDSTDTLCESDGICDQRLNPGGKCNLCCGADCDYF